MGLDCALTASLEKLDDLEYLTEFKALDYPFWVRSENRESMLKQYEKKMQQETLQAQLNFPAVIEEITSKVDRTGVNALKVVFLICRPSLV
jgi:hypothetical protein